MNPLVKICGTTSPEDARLAQEAGADFVGIIVEHTPSPRSVSLERAVEIARAVEIPVVAVTVNLPLMKLLLIQRKLQPHALQLHGDETPERVRELAERDIKVWSVVSSGGHGFARERALDALVAGAEAVLVDAAREVSAAGTVYGGTGKHADWQTARHLVFGARIVLAGGLTPQTVREAVQFVQPWAVDVVSGVEESKGVKDPQKVRAFVAAARGDL